MNFKEINQQFQDLSTQLYHNYPKQIRKLENKIFFQKFIYKYGIPHPVSRIIKKNLSAAKIKKFSAIFQLPKSHGGQGTFFASNKTDFAKLLAQGKLKTPLLYRSFVNGIPIGVTILVGQKKTIFSAIRMQAIDIKSSNINKYFGIQWLKKSSFNLQTIKKLENALKKLAAALRLLKFHGIANIDLMIKNDQIFTIECNPRAALSNTQIANTTELLHGLDIVKELLHLKKTGDLSRNRLSIPKTAYEGCTLDLDYLSENLQNQKIIHPPEIGFYKLTEETLSYHSDQPGNYLDENLIFIDHDMIADTLVNFKTDFGFALTHKPLFLVKKSLVLNSYGKKMQKALGKLLRTVIARTPAKAGGRSNPVVKAFFTGLRSLP